MLLFVFLCVVSNILLVYLTIKFAWRINFLSHPNTIFVTQNKPVAYMGGMAILLSIFLNSYLYKLLVLESYQLETTFFVPILLFTIVGLVDDYLELSPKLKVVLQLIALLITLFMGNIIAFTSILYIDIFLSAFYLLFIVNAFNLIDVSDGLLAGICIPGLVYFYVVSQFQILYLVILIALIAFLFFNRPNAKIYLGDTGSHLLGSITYIISVDYLNNSTFIIDNLIILGLIFSVILFEFGLLCYRRTKQNLSIFKGSPDHYSILLKKASWSKSKILFLSFMISSLFSGVAYFILPLPYTIKLAVAVASILVFSFFGFYLNKLNETKI